MWPFLTKDVTPNGRKSHHADNQITIPRMKISFPRKNGYDSSLITFLAFSAVFIIWGEIIFPQPLQKADSDAKGRTTIFRRGYTIERNKIHHRKRFNTPNNRTLKPRKMNSSISFKSKQLLKQNAAKKKSQPPNTPQKPKDCICLSTIEEKLQQEQEEIKSLRFEIEPD